MTEPIKLRQSNPLIDIMTIGFWEVIQQDRFLVLNLAEVVGCLEFVKNNLITGDWPD